MRSSARSFLLLNRMGEFRVSQCRDCQQLNPIDRSSCQSCQSLNLKQLRYGTRAIETELHRLFPDRTIIRIDNQQADLTATAVEAADIIIGTEKALRWVDLETVDVIGVVSVDHLLVYPHFQAHERVWQLLTTLLVAERPTWVQTWSPHNSVITTACRNRYWEFAKPELDLRSQLALPPFGDSIRLMNHRTGVTTVTRTPMDLTTIDPDVLIDRVE
jgi:primosomal protein N' (replication factor Y)